MRRIILALFITFPIRIGRAIGGVWRAIDGRRGLVDWAQIITCGLALAALWIATSALKENTKANHTASRALLYATEWNVNDREFNKDFVMALYAQPPTKDVHDYWRMRLLLHTSRDSIIHTTSVTELRERVLGWTGFSIMPAHAQRLARASAPIVAVPTFMSAPSPSRGDGPNTFSDLEELRQLTAHFTLIMDHLHAAWDFCEGNVFTKEELKTWMGYVTDIGPHPLFLVVIENWRQQEYMSKNFAAYLRNMMRDDPDHPEWKQVIATYYPQMDDESVFLEGLPDY